MYVCLFASAHACHALYAHMFPNSARKATNEFKIATAAPRTSLFFRKSRFEIVVREKQTPRDRKKKRSARTKEKKRSVRTKTRRDSPKRYFFFQKVTLRKRDFSTKNTVKSNVFNKNENVAFCCENVTFWKKKSREKSIKNNYKTKCFSTFENVTF